MSYDSLDGARFRWILRRLSLTAPDIDAAEFKATIDKELRGILSLTALEFVHLFSPHKLLYKMINRPDGHWAIMQIEEIDMVLYFLENSSLDHREGLTFDGVWTMKMGDFANETTIGQLKLVSDFSLKDS